MISTSVQGTPLPPSVRTRVLLSLLMGLLAGLFTTFFYFRAGPQAASDWDAVWRGAGVLLEGGNPFTDIPIFPGHLNYPLPAVMISVLFAPFPLHIARPLFTGVGTAIFTFIATRRCYWPLYFVCSGAMLGSWPPVAWSPLLVAAALTPVLGWVLVAKPTTGFALWSARPNRMAAFGGAALVLLSLAIRPHWVGEWLHGVVGNPHRPLVLRPGGFLLLLGLLRWRRPEGRLLAALCLVPQTTSLYETLPLVLLVETRLQALAFALLTMLASALHHVGPEGPWPIGAEFQWRANLALVYLPALLLVLRRPNETRETPAW